METIQNLDRLIRREDEYDAKRPSDVSDDMRQIIDKTKAEIRAAFRNGKKAKARLKA